MADFAPRVFDFGKPAVCQQPFVHADVRYEPGDSFPYEKLGLGKLEMRGFWLASLVDFVAAPPPKATKHDKREARAAR